MKARNNKGVSVTLGYGNTFFCHEGQVYTYASLIKVVDGEQIEEIIKYSTRFYDWFSVL